MAKMIDNIFQMLGIKHEEKEPMKIPKTVQDSIPYLGAYENGIIQTGIRSYVKLYGIADLNFTIESMDEQKRIFGKFMEFLGSFGPEICMQIVIYNKTLNSVEFEQKILLPMCNDFLNEYRNEMNDMLIEKMSAARNNIIHEKYVAISTNADDIEAAKTTFSRIDVEMAKNGQRLTGEESKPFDIKRYLEILYSIYNMNSFMPLNQKIRDANKKLTDSFTLKDLRKAGLTTKDAIGPCSMSFEYDHLKIGDNFARVLFLTNLPSYLRGDVLTEMANMPFNMLTSVQLRALPQEEAIRKVNACTVNINANVGEQQKKASKRGYSAELISPELQNNQKEVQSLMDDLTQDNQKLFMSTITMCVFAESKEQLDKNTKVVQATAERFICQAKKLSGQQEMGFNTCLPLAKNDLRIERMLNTRGAAIFLPFSVKELMQKDGLYYGLNAVSNQLILYDRLSGKSGNGCILGTTGSGKSFAAKEEIVNVLLKTDDDVIIIDPENEYSPMAQMFKGQVIRIAPGSGVYINPMDMSLDYGCEDDPVTAKADFLSSICETASGSRFPLSPAQKSVIDRCVKNVYMPYVEELRRYGKNEDQEIMPTLKDLYNELRSQPQPEAINMALTLERFAVGTQDSFSKKTNVNINNRFTVYNIKDIGSGMKAMGLQICLDNVWNRMIENFKKGKRTRIYCDEFHLLAQTATSAKYTQQIWKRARKWNGVPTGITQQIEDLLKSSEGRAIISNSEFLLLLNQDPYGRMQLQQMLNISNTEMEYITNSGSGQGLIYNGKDIIPFVNEFPKNTELYRAMTTKPDEIAH